MANFRLHRTHLIRGAVVAHDMGAAGLALGLGLSLRLGQMPGTEYFLPILAFMAIAAVIGYVCGLNGGVWRYASLSDLEAVVKTATFTVLSFSLLLFLVNRLDMMPRASIVISWGAMILALSGSRLAYRLIRNRRTHQRSDHRRNVLLLGASGNAEYFLKAVGERHDLPYRVLGLIDDRDRRTGLSIRGHRVLGTAKDLDAVIEKLAQRGLAAEALVLTNTQAVRGDESFDLVAEAAKRHGLKLLRLPELNDLQGGGERSAAALAPQPIAIEDLLPRRVVKLNKDKVGELVLGSTVLVTGAGGSIGSELCRQLLSLGPKRLVLLDSSEYLLYAIGSELSRNAGATQIVPRLGNVRNRNQIRALFEEQQPEIVFHAAALKHVPIVEDQPLEGLNTNVLGTRNVADAALSVNAKAMVLISTDKAVNPTNVMGASKRMAESYCQSLDVAGRTHFVTVRFGNVLGSAGSVVPLFEKQIRDGGPVTVTHPEIERYFMTIPEAAQLVLHATTHGVGATDDRGQIFVLDMGRPVKIVDVARKMIRLAGFEPEQEIKIEFVGLRPGEKMHEELFHASMELVATSMDGVLSSASRRPFNYADISDMFDELAAAIADNDIGAGLQIVKRMVPEYVTDERLASFLKAAPALRLVVTKEPA